MCNVKIVFATVIISFIDASVCFGYFLQMFIQRMLH